jgi:glycosyltransferase involved in cell wall biosynthesis
MSEPTITVVIPTYGRAQFLGQALESLANQSLRPHEVIVVDDCSPEPTALPDTMRLAVTVLRHARNQGPGAARNSGASHASGDWILFLDDDDLLTPHRLRWAVAEMGEARAHVTDVEWFNPDGSTEWAPSRVYSGDMRDGFTHEKPPQLGQVVFRREDVLQFDPTLRVSEDTEWWLRMADRAVFAWHPEVGLRYRCHPEVRAGVRSDTRFQARRQVAMRHAGGFDRRTRARLYGNVGAEALLAGLRPQAAAWTLRSLAVRPSLLNAKRLMRSVLPLDRQPALPTSDGLVSEAGSMRGR